MNLWDLRHLVLVVDERMFGNQKRIFTGEWKKNGLEISVTVVNGT